jgi:hypothetical protein
VAITALERASKMFSRDDEYREELIGFVAGIQAAHNYARLSGRKLDAFEAEIRAFAAPCVSG